MDFRRQALFIVVALSSVLGCRQGQAVKRELLERELRIHEDRIWQLEGELEDAKRELDEARGVKRDDCPPGTQPGLGGLLNGGLFNNNGGNTSPPMLTPPTNTTPFNNTLPPPSSVLPGSSSGAPSSTSPTGPTNTRPSVILPPHGDTAPPAVELPGGAAPPFRGAPIISPPDSSRPEGVPAPGGAAPPFRPGGAQLNPSQLESVVSGVPALKPMSSPKFIAPSMIGPGRTDDSIDDVLPVPLPADRQVKTLSLNRRTGGWNSDGKPGDEGVSIVVEPRNARGEVVPTPGSVSIVLIDPALEGEAGRFAKWDFAGDDVDALIRSAATGGSGGMHFELPWPESAPAHSKLMLFIRYTTADGRRLQVEKEIHVDLGSGVSSAWKNPTSAISQPQYAATRASGPNGAARADVAVQTAGESPSAPAASAPSTPLHWGRPKPTAMNTPAPTESPEMLAPPTNAQPLASPSNPGPSSFGPPSGTMNGPSLGPSLAPPRNAPVYVR